MGAACKSLRQCHSRGVDLDPARDLTRISLVAVVSMCMWGGGGAGRILCLSVCLVHLCLALWILSPVEVRVPTTSQDPRQVPHQSDLSRCSCIAPSKSQQPPACAPPGSLCPKWKQSCGRNCGDWLPLPRTCSGESLQASCTVHPFLPDEGDVHSMPVKRARPGSVPLLRWVYQWGGPGSTRARMYNQPCLSPGPASITSSPPLSQHPFCCPGLIPGG